MGQRRPRAARRAAREGRDRYRVGVDELQRRAAAGLDLWTGEPPPAPPAPARSGRRWTAEEDELVRSLPPEEAAARTGRSPAAVRARRRALAAGGGRGMATFTLIDGNGEEHQVRDAGGRGGAARFTAPFAVPPPQPWRLRDDSTGEDRQVIFTGTELVAGATVWVAEEVAGA